MAANADGDGVRVRLDGETLTLSRREAVRLRRSLGEALVEEREFLDTTGIHRPDGCYVVARRAADSQGHRKVFDSFGALRALYDRLPARFTAEHVGREGLTGSRRHMVVRHLAEHPAFDCRLVRRQPLTARKQGGGVASD